MMRLVRERTKRVAGRIQKILHRIDTWTKAKSVARRLPNTMRNFDTQKGAKTAAGRKPKMVKNLDKWMEKYDPDKRRRVWKRVTWCIVLALIVVFIGITRLQRRDDSWDVWLLLLAASLWGSLIAIYLLANAWQGSRAISWLMSIAPIFLILSGFIVWRQWTYRTDVVVLKHDLPAYHLLTDDDASLESRRWVGLPDGALKEIDGIEGRITLTELDEGEPLEEGDLSPAFAEAPVMINVPVTRAMASDGDIEPGTFVDISLAPVDQQATPTVLQGSVVLDVHGPDAGEDPGAPGDVTYIITLALTQACHDQFVLAGGTVASIAAHLHRTASTMTIAEASSSDHSPLRRVPCFETDSPTAQAGSFPVMVTTGDDRETGSSSGYAPLLQEPA